MEKTWHLSIIGPLKLSCTHSMHLIGTESKVAILFFNSLIQCAKHLTTATISNDPCYSSIFKLLFGCDWEVTLQTDHQHNWFINKIINFNLILRLWGEKKKYDTLSSEFYHCKYLPDYFSSFGIHNVYSNALNSLKKHTVSSRSINSK